MHNYLSTKCVHSKNEQVNYNVWKTTIWESFSKDMTTAHSAQFCLSQTGGRGCVWFLIKLPLVCKTANIESRQSGVTHIRKEFYNRNKQAPHHYPKGHIFLPPLRLLGAVSRSEHVALTLTNTHLHGRKNFWITENLIETWHTCHSWHTSSPRKAT